MDTEEITHRINLIHEKCYDDETAHSMEDELYSDFILYVSELEESLPSLAAKAKLVLTEYALISINQKQDNDL